MWAVLRCVNLARLGLHFPESLSLVPRWKLTKSNWGESLEVDWEQQSVLLQGRCGLMW